MLKAVKYSTLSDLKAEWDPLVASSAARGPFLSWEWQNLWWQTFADGAEAWLLAVREGDTLVGIAPLMSRQGQLTFSCGQDVCDYLDVIARPGYEEAVADAVVAYLCDKDWASLDLYCLPPTATALRYLPDDFARAGLTAKVAQLDVCPLLDLPADWESYLASLGKKERHELRRKLRRLESAGRVHTYALADGEIGPRDVDDFLALHRCSTPEKAMFMDERMEQFFRGLFARLGRDGLLRLYFMELDGQRVATTMCFVQNQELLLYNSGYNPDLARLSVGLLLKAYCLQDAIALGLRRFDFLRGNERYKYDLGGKDLPIYRLLVTRRG